MRVPFAAGGAAQLGPAACGACMLGAWSLKSLWCACWRLCEQSWHAPCLSLLTDTPLPPAVRSPRLTRVQPALMETLAPDLSARRWARSHGLPCRVAGPPWPRCPDFPPQTGCQAFHVKTLYVEFLSQIFFKCHEFDQSVAWAPSYDLCLSKSMQSMGYREQSSGKCQKEVYTLSGAVGTSSGNRLWSRLL